MSSDFLFAFLLFFQVQVESIRESGFYKLIEKEYPQLSEGLKQFESEEGVQELLNLTGLDAEDLISFSMTLEGLDDIAKLRSTEQSPKIGSEIELLVNAEFRGELKEADLIAYMLTKLEEEKGEKVRKKVEKSKKNKGGISFLTLPPDLIDDQTFASDLLFAIKKGNKKSELILGIPRLVKQVVAEKNESLPLASFDTLSEGRQMTFAIKIDPALWNRPEFEADQQNPLFAGLVSSIKGIREIGLGVSFLEDSMGLEVSVNCKDAQSALGLWTVAQGGLGMAQLAMSQQGGKAPEILTRIKTEAVEQNVFVRVEVLPTDLKEFSNQIPPASSEVVSSKSDSLQGKKAPIIETKFLSGKDFKLSDYEGKIVVLDFWATWCGPCVRALPALIRMSASFDSEEVSFIAVNQGESEEIISSFLNKMEIAELTVAMDQNQKIGRDFGVQGIPRTVVIDKDGVVRHIHVGFSPSLGDLIKAEVQTLLSK